MSAPPILTAQAAALVGRIGYLADLKSQVNNARAFRTRAEQLEKLVNRFTPLAESESALRAGGVAVSGMEDRISVATALLQRAQATFANDRTAAADFKRAEFRDMHSTIEAFCDEYESRLKLAWSTHALAKVPTLNEEVLSVFESVPAYADAVRRIRTRLRELRASAALLPRDAADVVSFEAALKAVDEEWQGLGGGQVPAEVRELIRAASSSLGAPISALTPLVLEWLDKHPGVSASLGIRVIRS